MKAAIVLIFGIMVGGCASQKQAKVDSDQPKPALTPYYTPNPAHALVFDPPITQYGRQIDLSRENRSPGAFYGYEQTTVDMYSVYQRDDQRAGGIPSRFERDARYSRSSVTYR